MLGFFFDDLNVAVASKNKNIDLIVFKSNLVVLDQINVLKWLN